MVSIMIAGMIKLIRIEQELRQCSHNSTKWSFLSWWTRLGALLRGELVLIMRIWSTELSIDEMNSEKPWL